MRGQSRLDKTQNILSLYRVGFRGGTRLPSECKYLQKNSSLWRLSMNNRHKREHSAVDPAAKCHALWVCNCRLPLPSKLNRKTDSSQNQNCCWWAKFWSADGLSCIPKLKSFLNKKNDFFCFLFYSTRNISFGTLKTRAA